MSQTLPIQSAVFCRAPRLTRKLKYAFSPDKLFTKLIPIEHHSNNKQMQKLLWDKHL